VRLRTIDLNGAQSAPYEVLSKLGGDGVFLFGLRLCRAVRFVLGIKTFRK
jgi:hypothetical protein